MCWHAGVGVALAVLVWVVGAGIVAAGERVLGRRVVAGDFVLAYLFGLLAVVAAAFFVLLQPVVGVVALVLLAAGAVAGWRSLGRFGEAPALALRSAAAAAP